ncbi:exodeoxyribonuclease-3 [Sphingomonas jejuensis]|uniref:Exodeoxyribonuclease-3 n=1 Tax=Sphingomonas jejuensis TaxID=904715 RepID=A0ABX0XNE5_9SPHN|nr:exodeoxyribonuclease-3 [Sphingomonas jejuensis]
MRIATYNINGIKARLLRLLEWLGETTPDVVCLQELKSQDEGFPAADIEAAGYQAIWHGQKSFNGVAILSRAGLDLHETQRGLPGDPEDAQSRYLEAAVNGVIVGCLYLPNGNPQPGPKFDYKLAWMERLAARGEALLACEAPVILAGDWNVIPTTTHDDTFSVRAMADDALMQPESQAAFRRILAQGWIDAIRTFQPSGPAYTFWDYQAGAWARDAGFRIDHLLASPVAADRLVRAGIDRAYRGREKASDHVPVWVELR